VVDSEKCEWPYCRDAGDHIVWYGLKFCAVHWCQLCVLPLDKAKEKFGIVDRDKES